MGFATEGVRRQEDYKNLEEKMSARMKEGFKIDENARKLVRNEVAIMKDELNIFTMGSGSTVCSEASTGVAWDLVPLPALRPHLLERDLRSKKDGVQRLGHRLHKKQNSKNQR